MKFPNFPYASKESVIIGLIWLALLGNIVIFGISQDDSMDVWSHALHGRILVKEMKCPKFSHYSCVPDQDSSRKLGYADQITLFLLLDKLGYPGLLLLKIVLLGSICFWIFKALALRHIPSVLVNAACLLFLLEGYHRFKPRGDFFNLLFWPIYLYLLDKYSRHPGKFIWYLLPLQILWINLHPLAVTGPAIIGLYGFSHRMEKKWKQARTLFLAAATAFLLSFIHPDGYRGLFFSFNVLNTIAGKEHSVFLTITEFMPLAQVESPWILHGYYGILLITGGLFLLGSKGNWHRFILFLGTAWGAWRYSRLIGFFALYSAYILPLLAWQVTQRPFLTRLKKIARRRIEIVALLLLACHLFTAYALLSQRFFKWNEDAPRSRPYPSNVLLPVEAVKFLQRHDYRGNIFTDYSTGGYVGYHLYPQGRIFINSLSAAYSSKHLSFYNNIAQGKINPESAILAYDIDLFVLTHNSACDWLTRWLYRSPHWLMLYLDESTAVFAAKNSPLAQRTLPLSPVQVEKAVHLPRITRSARRLTNMALFFLHVGENRRARAILLDALQKDEHNENTPMILNNLGNIESNNGNYHKALQFYVKSAQASPGNPPRQNIRRLFAQKNLNFQADDPWQRKALEICPSILQISRKK